MNKFLTFNTRYTFVHRIRFVCRHRHDGKVNGVDGNR